MKKEACAARLHLSIAKIPGVKKISVRSYYTKKSIFNLFYIMFPQQELLLLVDMDKLKKHDIIKAIEELGYQVDPT